MKQAARAQRRPNGAAMSHRARASVADHSLADRRGAPASGRRCRRWRRSRELQLTMCGIAGILADTSAGDGADRLDAACTTRSRIAVPTIAAPGSRRAVTRLSRTRGCRSSIPRRPAISRCRSPTAASRSPTTARSTTSPSCARSLIKRRHGVPIEQRHRSHPAPVRSGGPGVRRAAARHVRIRDLGRARAHVLPRARSLRHQAALLPRGRRRADVRLRSARAGRVGRAAPPSMRTAAYRLFPNRLGARAVDADSEACARSRPATT